MMALSAWKKRIPLADDAPPKQLERAIERQMVWASGTEYFQNRDPVYHISESFRQTFATLGMRQSSPLYAAHMEEGPGLPASEKPLNPEEAVGEETLSSRERDIAQSRFFAKTSMDGVFSPAPGKEGFLGRFSETAFSRGNLAGAVMRGTGQMMLVSCLKRTVGQSQPKNLRQRMLFENASATRNVKGHSPDKAVFNKGEADSAIGLVVDVVRDARRTVDSLTSLLEGNQEGASGSGTLQRMYPFLSTAREEALLTQYKDVLRASGSDEKRLLIQRAAMKAQAVIAKKRQMRTAFIHHLRALSDQAALALRAFQDAGFREAALGAMEGYEPPPPETPSDRDDTGELADVYEEREKEDE